MADGGFKQSTGRHSHTTGFQMIYVLAGEARFWFEDAGEFSAGGNGVKPVKGLGGDDGVGEVVG